MAIVLKVFLRINRGQKSATLCKCFKIVLTNYISTSYSCKTWDEDVITDLEQKRTIVSNSSFSNA